jgi:hypothetical protein
VSVVQVLQTFLLFAAAVAAVFGGLRWLDARRLKVSVRGGPEVTINPHAAGARGMEAFVFYVLSDRDHPVTVETCGITGQDTRGDYWRLSIGMPPLGAIITKGSPYRWEMPFNDIAQFGIDVTRRVYAFARIAQPPRVCGLGARPRARHGAPSRVLDQCL